MMEPRGRFSDGKTAARHAVTLRVAGGAARGRLEIVGEDGKLLAVWDLAGIEVIDELAGGRGLRLTHASDPAARLMVEGRDNVAGLRACAPGAFRRKRLRPATLARIAAWTGLTGALLAALYFALPRLVEPVAALVPVAWEERVGEAVIEQIGTVLGGEEGGDLYCTGAAGAAALERATGRLAAVADTPYRFRVRVADLDQVNAFAVPGGHIVLLSGLIEAAEAPEEVVGVLAHEMAHVVERHPTEGLLRNLGISVVFQSLFGDPSSSLPSLGEIGGALVMFSYSRADEAEADALGVEMLKQAGIRTDGLQAFFERLADAEGALPSFLAYFSTHPPSEERARATAAATTGGDAGLTPGEWAALQAICTAEDEDGSE
ncbi:MAG: M48 family metallopeptidase [Alphaproteobacteria bacterium]